MPWPERCTLSSREEFIHRMLDPHRVESISALCSEYGVARKTAYKWRKRYLEEGDSAALSCQDNVNGGFRNTAPKSKIRPPIQHIDRGFLRSAPGSGPAAIAAEAEDAASDALQLRFIARTSAAGRTKGAKT